ncbi:DSHCT domain family [Synechococcus sp. PCC 7335]|uniref:DEAD/DEAH box helicase n=1 Tax=Synechococcus sp. (strain ATCC 29403 / PCC 7335) TaxID=91464 RepID=UPI00017ED9BB|nr:DEAD/DEAH box helicase [Synechococcus sp. PCC 7335]EDX86141.1 DSHCT domain family [Synechococcus sp. PCC 7335]
MLAPETLFPFRLDDFQIDAIAALNQGQSIIVCAPTGSGKTLIGEYAIHRALEMGRRVFYTTPLKALSNQKLRDFQQAFGEESVGLLTGDSSVNREAPVVVMTTEIFRNMLYGTTIGEVGTSLRDVQAVILDECHYMNDRQRGTVWEESVIYCPPEIQLVGLSATIENGGQLTDWINEVHGPTRLIYSDYRPVPLNFHFAVEKGIFPLLNNQKTSIHPRLKNYRKPPRRQRGQKKKAGATLPGVVSQLQAKDMLPAIYFIFSRKGCDKAVQAVASMNLVSAAEAELLKRRIDRFVERNPEAIRTNQLEPLYRGVAAHHAGILPAWKSLVEELFQAGLIKVVFATETLAAGINMPARTTVIASLSKRTDSGHRLLHASEFLQMSGRAGRRGMDVEGHVVTVESPFEGAKEAASLALAPPDPLVSQFTPSYGMVLNLLQVHTAEEAQELIERSFGQYLATLHLAPQKKAIAKLEQDIAVLQDQLAYIDEAALAEYEKLRGWLREEERLLKILQQQAEESIGTLEPVAISFAMAGTVLSLKGKNIKVATPLPAVLVSKVPGPGQFPFLVCLGANNRWYVATVKDVAALPERSAGTAGSRLRAADDLTPPVDLIYSPGKSRKGNEVSAAVAAKIPEITAIETQAPEVKEQQEKAAAVAQKLAQNPVAQLENPKAVVKQQKRLLKLEEERRDRLQKYENYTHHYWLEFVSLMQVLEDFECLEENTPTEMGQLCAAIRGDNELWLGMALASGEFDALEPQQFAAACAGILMENNRSDTWIRYHATRPVLEALGGLRSLRRRIFQAQRRQDIQIPVWLEEDLIALVEQWALETEWQVLCDNTSLDEGDVVRLLRRTLDFLSQIPHVPYLSESVRSNARQAAYLINRFPVNETPD